jgi:hypothetical protein
LQGMAPLPDDDADDAAADPGAEARLLLRQAQKAFVDYRRLLGSSIAATSYFET